MIKISSHSIVLEGTRIDRTWFEANYPELLLIPKEAEDYQYSPGRWHLYITSDSEVVNIGGSWEEGDSVIAQAEEIKSAWIASRTTLISSGENWNGFREEMLADPEFASLQSLLFNLSGVEVLNLVAAAIDGNEQIVKEKWNKLLIDFQGQVPAFSAAAIARWNQIATENNMPFSFNQDGSI